MTMPNRPARVDDVVADAVASLHIERRGGFAGLRASAEPCLGSMTPAQQAGLRQLLSTPVAAAGDLSTPAAEVGRSPSTRAMEEAPSAPRPDRFHYHVRLGWADGAERLLDLPEEAMPEALAALVRPALG